MAPLIRTHHRLACFVAALLGCACSNALAQTSDILWRNTRTGANVIWKGGDFRVIQAVPAASTNWEVIGTARSSYSGDTSLIWRNSNDGRVLAWANAQTDYMAYLPIDRRWTLAGTGFFDTDTHACDFLWRDATGQNMLWRWGLDAADPLIAVANMDWEIAGIGDFDGDVYSDILWRNKADGRNVIWLRGDARHLRSVTAVTNLAWRIVGVGDFDGDDVDDILWRESKTGRNVVWNWARAGAYARTLVTAPTLSWHVVGVGDFNTDGKSDVLWRDAATGRNVIWSGADGRQVIPVARVPDQAWVVAAVGDFTPRGW